MQQYNYDKELVKDFLRWASDTHKCALVEFPDEFAASQYVSYRFVNVGNLIDQFIEEK